MKDLEGLLQFITHVKPDTVSFSSSRTISLCPFSFPSSHSRHILTHAITEHMVNCAQI